MIQDLSWHLVVRDDNDVYRVNKHKEMINIYRVDSNNQS